MGFQVGCECGFIGHYASEADALRERRWHEEIGHVRVVVRLSANLYETRAAQRDPRYRTWLGDLSYASIRLCGRNAIYAVDFARQFRRWYRQGLYPSEAVGRWQKALSRVANKRARKGNPRKTGATRRAVEGVQRGYR